MNELNVVYHNKLNGVSLEKFSAIEMDLFMGICLLMKDKGDAEQYLNLRQIREVSNYKSTSKERLEKDLFNVQKKLRYLNYASIRTNKFVGDVYLFSAFGKCLDRDDTWLVAVNKYATYILNHLTQEWTIFRLNEHNSLNSKYSKVLFRLLKQWRKVGKVSVTVEELRKHLDIPEGYSVSKIDERIINPALDELSLYFQDLTVKKRYAVNDRHHNYLEGYIFSFTPEAE